MLALLPGLVRAGELPEGILVWSKGDAGVASSRRIHRRSLGDAASTRPLTGGEDVQPQISPDGKWVAYAKAKLPDADYHQFHLWQLYLVSIDGAATAAEEMQIDDSGYWPSWGSSDVLYYSQVDDDRPGHTRVWRVDLDADGGVVQRRLLLETRAPFSAVDQVNECFVAPDETWMAARTRGHSSINGVSAITWEPVQMTLLGRAGDFGCMPHVAPSGEWAIMAGGAHGIRWGDAPHVVNGRQDQVLVPPRSADDRCYHPTLSTDERWLVVGHSEDEDHNAGAYDLYLYRLADRTATDGQLLVSGGFNGWPHLYTGPRPLPGRPASGNTGGCGGTCSSSRASMAPGLLLLLLALTARASTWRSTARTAVRNDGSEPQ